MPYNPDTIARIEAVHKDRQYQQMRCRLCGWMENGRTFEEAMQNIASHERLVRCEVQKLKNAGKV